MDYISGWCKSKRTLEGCTAIVTGCNTGIGKETALDFYKRGAKVIMACRNITKAESAKADIESAAEKEKTKGTLVVHKIDLCSLKSVREFADKVLASESRVDILVNNAGVMACPEGRTEDGFETHIGSNHFAHALLTFLLLPHLVKSDHARVVTVSSLLHDCALDLDDINIEKRQYDARDAYAKSKAANVLFSRALAIKLKEHNINNVTTYCLHPGVIRTEISRHFDQTIGYGAGWIFNNVMSWFLKSPRCGAQTTIHCSVDEACANETGLYYSDCAVKSPSKYCQDDDKAARLFDLTVQMVKCDPFDNVKLSK